MMVHNFFFGIGRIPDKGVKKTSVLELILPLLRYYLFESDYSQPQICLARNQITFGKTRRTCDMTNFTIKWLTVIDKLLCICLGCNG